jgi:hypothetical protein
VFSSEHAIVLPAEEIPAWFYRNGLIDFCVDGCEDLMHLHLSHDGCESYLFFNLSATTPIDAEITFPYRGEYTVYDAWSNCYAKGHTEDGRVHLYLPQRSTLTVLFGALALPTASAPLRIASDDLDWRSVAPDTIFSLSMRYAKEGEWEERTAIAAKDLKNLAPEFSRFTGTLKYRANLLSDKAVEYMDLGEVGEIAELFVNGVSCGVCLESPFRFYVGDAWHTGENAVEIVIATNCAYRRRDRMSCLLPLPPTGLLGPVRMA